MHAEADRIAQSADVQAGRSDGVGGGRSCKIVDAPKPPLRVFFGELPLQLAKADYESRLKTWEEWQPVSELAQG